MHNFHLKYWSIHAVRSDSLLKILAVGRCYVLKQEHSWNQWRVEEFFHGSWFALNNIIVVLYICKVFFPFDLWPLETEDDTKVISLACMIGYLINNVNECSLCEKCQENNL